MREHGNEYYWIDGEGWVGGKLSEHNDVSRPDPRSSRIERSPDAGHVGAIDGTGFTFFRMFPTLGRFRPGIEPLRQLGRQMESDSLLLTPSESIPAGYTYLGQFITHDITFDVTQVGLTEEVDASELDQVRSPSLDLDSLYGRDPGQNPELYAHDQLRLHVGHTSPTKRHGKFEFSIPNDLPRRKNREAIIADPRNDENLAVAQTHLAFAKFHNRIVELLESANPRPEDVFSRARTQVTLLYQSVVLNDFLPRVVEERVLSDVLSNGPKLFEEGGRNRGMPIEFSVAAFRFGHSLIDRLYQWNRVFRAGGPGGSASLLDLFRSTGRNGDLWESPTLPSNWPINWKNFFDFGGGEATGPFNKARSFDPNLVSLLGSLPRLRLLGESIPGLATRDLLRGRLLGLPSGQEVANHLSEKGIAVEPLTSDEIAEGTHESVLRDNNLHIETPLWYYLLKEAEVRARGLRLGPVGSRIVVEVLVRLMLESRPSILKDANRLMKIEGLEANPFKMVDLLKVVGDLNPLGD